MGLGEAWGLFCRACVSSLSTVSSCGVFRDHNGFETCPRVFLVRTVGLCCGGQECAKERCICSDCAQD